MSKLCRISVVGLYLLLLTHITHSFVLLTANVEDLKKIARKFVSDSLAERITDFIARATETLVEEQNNSEENKAQRSSQVSAENSMYNVEKTINDKLEDIIKTKKETTDTPKSLNTEKEKHKGEHNTTRSKVRKGQKLLHGKSRYIETVKIAKPNKTSSEKISEENNDNNSKESTQNIESRTPKVRKNRKTKKRYKLRSGFDSNTAAGTTGIPIDTDNAKVERKTNNKPDKKPSANPMSVQITAGQESDSYDTGNDDGTEKAINDFDLNKNTEKSANNYDQYDIERNKNIGTQDANAHMSENEDYDNEINNIMPKDERILTGSLVKEKELNDDKWWEKKLTTHVQSDADGHAEGKSWF